MRGLVLSLFAGVALGSAHANLRSLRSTARKTKNETAPPVAYHFVRLIHKPTVIPGVRVCNSNNRAFTIKMSSLVSAVQYTSDSCTVFLTSLRIGTVHIV